MQCCTFFYKCKNLLDYLNDISIVHGNCCMKRRKSKVLMEETLDIALDFRCSNNSLEFFQNPHLIYTISRINSVSISFEAIFNFGENDR